MKTNEIIKALRFCAKDGESGGGCKGCPLDYDHPYEAGCIRAMMTAAAGEIEKLTARCARYAKEIAMLKEQVRWIPVTERLPATEGRYAVITEKGSVTVVTFYPECGRFQRIFTHWMSLPTKPETEKTLSADDFCNYGVKANGGMSDE